MLFMSKTSTAPKPAFVIASRVRARRYSCSRRKSTRSSQSTCMRPGAGSDATGNSRLGMLVSFWLLLQLPIVKAIRDLPVLGVKLEVRAPRLQLKQAREIDVAQLVADQVHDDLMYERRDRHRDVHLAPGL